MTNWKLRALACAMGMALVFSARPALADDDDDEDEAKPAPQAARRVDVNDDEEDEPAPKPLPRRRGRRVASTEGGSSYDDVRVTRNGGRGGSDVQARFSGLAGMSSLTSSTTDPSFVNATLEVNIDVTFWKYLSVSADVNGDVVTGKFADSTTSGSPSLSKQIYGGMIDVKGQYPFLVSRGAAITPKGGIGFGLQDIEFGSNTATSTVTTTSTTSSGTVSTAQLAGAYFIVGFDVSPQPDLVFFADYLHSIGGVGTFSGSTGSSSTLTDMSFDRFRIGGYYRIGPNWGLGAQGVRRSMGFTGASSPFAPSGVTSTSNDVDVYQFLGMFYVQLQ